MIMTTEPNELMKSIHKPLPVIVQKELEDLWLAPEAKGPEELNYVRNPTLRRQWRPLRYQNWSTPPTNDRPECIEPL